MAKAGRTSGVARRIRSQPSRTRRLLRGLHVLFRCLCPGFVVGVQPQQLEGVLPADLAAIRFADWQAVKPVVLFLNRLVGVVDGIENAIRPDLEQRVDERLSPQMAGSG